MKHRLARTWGLALTSSLVAVACGGRVDGGSGGFSSEPSSTAIPGQRPPSGSRPTRPPIAPMTPASVASMIAETYCKSFSSCCVGKGEPPIDVARCRELTAKEVEQKISPTAELAVSDVALCVDAIEQRITACGTIDLKWWTTSDLALSSPPSVQAECRPVFGGGRPGSDAGAPCTSDATCVAGAKCAIDLCASTGSGAIGDACVIDVASCWDGNVCTAKVCAKAPDVAAGGMCSADEECRLGLLCFKGACAPAREHPELYKPRFSPYRIGADTCGAFTTL